MNNGYNQQNSILVILKAFQQKRKKQPSCICMLLGAVEYFGQGSLAEAARVN
jgi:hypothetical protein